MHIVMIFVTYVPGRHGRRLARPRGYWPDNCSFEKDMEPLDTELRKVEKTESRVLALAAAVSILSAVFLVYVAVSSM